MSFARRVAFLSRISFLIFFFFFVHLTVSAFSFPSVEVILDRLTRSSSPHVLDFVRSSAVKGSHSRKGEREWEWRQRSKGEMEGGGRERSPSLMWALIACQRSMIHLLHTHTHAHTHYTANVWWHNATWRIWVVLFESVESLLCHGRSLHSLALRRRVK